MRVIRAVWVGILPSSPVLAQQRSGSPRQPPRWGFSRETRCLSRPDLRQRGLPPREWGRPPSAGQGSSR